MSSAKAKYRLQGLWMNELVCVYKDCTNTLYTLQILDLEIQSCETAWVYVKNILLVEISDTKKYLV